MLDCASAVCEERNHAVNEQDPPSQCQPPQLHMPDAASWHNGTVLEAPEVPPESWHGVQPLLPDIITTGGGFCLDVLNITDTIAASLIHALRCKTLSKRQQL